MFEWNDQIELLVLDKRKNGQTYKSIAEQIGSTISSVKHKVRRLQQNEDQDRYKHTKQKISHASLHIPKRNNLNILETHCGFGNMTKFYNQFGYVTAFDIDKKRIEEINAMGFEDVSCLKCDSEKEILRLFLGNCFFDVIDVDPYGFPSRYFPHILGLINDGLLLLTFPVMGVAQINKIMIEHYSAFWGIELSDKDRYIEKILKKLQDYGFMMKRQIKLLNVTKIDRIYRLAIHVEKVSLLKLVGLTVNRSKCRI